MMPKDMLQQIVEAVGKGIAKAAFDMEAHAVRIVPVDTGRLRNSISVKVEGNSIILGANTEYDIHVEYGTFRTRAQPYIRPAIHAGVKKYIPQRIKQEVKKLA